MALSVPAEGTGSMARSAHWGNCVASSLPTRDTSVSTSSACILLAFTRLSLKRKSPGQLVSREAMAAGRGCLACGLVHRLFPFPLLHLYARLLYFRDFQVEGGVSAKGHAQIGAADSSLPIALIFHLAATILHQMAGDFQFQQDAPQALGCGGGTQLLAYLGP